MNANRGEIVLVNFNPVDPDAGQRPALIVQNQLDNERLPNRIVAQVTTNVQRANLKTQLLIDPSHPDWQKSGLKAPSVVNAMELVTVHQSRIIKFIGTLSAEAMQQIDECLKAALGLKS